MIPALPAELPAPAEAEAAVATLLAGCGGPSGTTSPAAGGGQDGTGN
jgi:hypothetical protein